MHRFMVFLLSFFMLQALFMPPASAQDKLPALPAPIQNLVDEGAQIRYLGNDYGVDSWLTIKNGQEQYFYVLPGGEAFLMGVMFDKKGKLVTVNQVQRLRQQGDDTLDTLADDPQSAQITRDKVKTAELPASDFSSPSERLFYEVENSNWVSVGGKNAPVIYSFVDPQCPHCHNFISDIRKDYLETGKLQVRLIPVGFRDETRAQAAFLIAAPDPQERWFKHMDGDETALPAKSDVNQQGVQRNLAIMQGWKFNVTPMTVYRAADNKIKILRGRPQDIPALMADLGIAG